MIIGVYVDTTDWGANFWDDPDTFGDDNFCYVNIPTDIVMKWFYDYIYNANDPEVDDFEKWYKEVYTADDTDGLYQYAKERGCNCWRVE